MSLPTEEGFERDLKMEVKNIILSNPGNKELRENLLPLWISNELSVAEAIDILDKADGKIETATILNDANKIVTLFNKPIINGYGFPIVTEHAISLRELEIKNYEKFTCSLFKAQGLDAQSIRDRDVINRPTNEEAGVVSNV